MAVTVSENLLNAADLIAALAHKGQFDEQGVPYIEHPRNVAAHLSTTEEKIVGLLHDVVEDTEVTLEDLQPIFGDKITEAVGYMTHDKKEPYLDYIKKLSGNDLARKVKLADLTHNMDPSRSKQITERQIQRNQKYHKAYDFLMEIEEQKHKKAE